jgi:hypothetical protein
MTATHLVGEKSTEEASGAPVQDDAGLRINNSPIHHSRIHSSPNRFRRFLGPRWAKVARDLATYKTRSLLVVLSIAVGVFAIGVIAGTEHIIDSQFNGAYLASKPAHATLSVSPFRGRPAGDSRAHGRGRRRPRPASASACRWRAAMAAGRT